MIILYSMNAIYHRRNIDDMNVSIMKFIIHLLPFSEALKHTPYLPNLSQLVIHYRASKKKKKKKRQKMAVNLQINSAQVIQVKHSF